ncbi:MAG: glycoside hydrolase family 16 protein, partial [Chitinophagaceae bacterium]
MSSVESSSSSSSSSVVISSSSSSVTSSSGWAMVWNDEFEGTTIDPAKWGYEQNCWGGGNNEQQCYTTQEKNAFIEDGVLNIVAVPYTSARLRTKNLQEWTFGRFEIRAKLPAGQGTWPAIWMLPTDSPYGVWAASGEIDIMEAVNLETITNGVTETRVYGTLHYGRTWPGNVSSGAPYTLPNSASPADDFHVYAMEWEDGEIRWYVDGVHYQTQQKTGWYSQYVDNGVLKNAPEGAPFDEDSAYHLLLNLAVGGSWAGNTNNTGINASVFPQTMQVDYVRVYECTVSPLTGQGCATVDDDVVLNPGNERPVIGDVELPGPPLFVMYGDELDEGLKFNSYNPDGLVSYSEVAEAGRGNVFNVVKTGANGNVYFQVNGDPTDLRNWTSDSELIFDVKVNSKAAGAKLLVKMDSGWPNVSDVEVPVGADGTWIEYRITLADLIDNGNSLASGQATLASIANTFVIDTSGAMDVSFDNIRIEGEAAEEPEYFAPTPLFNIFEDSPGTGLQIQSYNPSGQISASNIAEAGRGDVFNVVKTGAAGSFFFNITAGPGDLSNWTASGKLEFDLKVNSLAAGSKLLIKIDSGWPNVSDVEVTLPATGTWGSFSIDVADLLDNGNSLAGGIAS